MVLSGVGGIRTRTLPGCPGYFAAATKNERYASAELIGSIHDSNYNPMFNAIDAEWS